MEDFYTYNRAYHLKFKKLNESDSKSSRYLNNYLLPNMSKILDVEVVNYIAVEEDDSGIDHMILFLDEVKIQEFIEFCEDENIIEQHGDITNQLLIHDSLDEVIQKMLRSEEFEEKFNRFFEKNVTMDSILDKISLNGEDSLSEYEFNFLQIEVAKNRSENLH